MDKVEVKDVIDEAKIIKTKSYKGLSDAWNKIKEGTLYVLRGVQDSDSQEEESSENEVEKYQIKRIPTLTNRETVEEEKLNEEEVDGIIVEHYDPVIFDYK